MIKVDDEFMTEVGLNEMPAAEKQAFMEEAEAELETRVGAAMAERLTQEEIKEFSQIAEDDQALAWLNEKVPDFRDLVLQAFQTFKNEIAAGREQVLS